MAYSEKVRAVPSFSMFTIDAPSRMRASTVGTLVTPTEALGWESSDGTGISSSRQLTMSIYTIFDTDGIHA